MSDNKPTFNFSDATGNSNSNTPFASKPTGSLFGGGNNPNTGSGSSPFSLGGNKPQTSLFGSTGTQSTPNTSGPGLFGGQATSGPEQQKLLFGGSTTPSTFGSSNAGNSGGIFGAASTSNTTPPSFPFGQKPATTSASGTTGSLFGGATTSAPSATPAQAPSTNLFGASTGGSGSESGFVGLGSTSSAATGSTTPAPNKPSLSFGFGSTTPAGPPPGGNTNIFGNQGNQATSGVQQAPSSLFGSKPSTTSSTPTPNLFGAAGSSTSTSSNLFGGNANKPAQQASGSLFNQNKPATSTAPSGPGAPSQAPQTTQAQQSTATQSSLFGFQTQNSGAQGAQATPSKPLFNLGGATPVASSTPNNPPAFSFGGQISTTRQLGTSQTVTTSAGTTSGLFNPESAKNTPTTTSAAPMSSLFSNMSQSQSGGTLTAGAGPAITSAAPTSSLFSNLGKHPSATTTIPAAAASTTAASTAPLAASSATARSLGATTASAPAPTSSLFSGLGVKPAATSISQSSTSAAAPATSTTAAPNLGGSTAGPAPPAQSRLKNKSMDEIITRWASDLSKYQKEFQAQAEQVAIWDRTLVENSDKISKLYSKTFQAERDAAEVERQLTLVEGQQEELGMWLERYEKEVDEMIKNQVRGREGLQGPDQERERTYKLAEKLSDRLNELNRDLTEMIDEINGVSQTLSKSSKPDDPLSQVVRVLNSHLGQLQAIDSGATALQAKIAAAQKEGQRLGGANGWQELGSDPAEDFYRSFRGSRTERFSGVS